MRSLSARKDGTALVIGAIPPNLKLLPSNRKHLYLRAFYRCHLYDTQLPPKATGRAPRVGLEPTTTRLTAECSTIELSRIIMQLAQIRKLIFVYPV